MCLNQPTRCTEPLNNPALDVEYVNSTAAIAEPDALAIRFGYTDQVQYYGSNLAPSTMRTSTQRGISFRVPRFAAANSNAVTSLIETLHLGSDHQTLGCALSGAWFDPNNNNLPVQVTVAPWDWNRRYDDNDKSYLNTMRFACVGQMGWWKGNTQNVNFTLSHHCETDEMRDWDLLKGRLVSWTGLPGGNEHGTEITDWKHGLYKHGLSKI